MIYTDSQNLIEGLQSLKSRYETKELYKLRIKLEAMKSRWIKELKKEFPDLSLTFDYSDLPECETSGIGFHLCGYMMTSCEPHIIYDSVYSSLTIRKGTDEFGHRFYREGLEFVGF